MHNIHPFTLQFYNRLVKLQCVFTRAAYFDRLTVKEKRDAIELRPFFVPPNNVTLRFLSLRQHPL
jgi:hypothetical protein